MSRARPPNQSAAPTFDDLIAELAEAESRAMAGGGKARQERHKRLGRLGARDRIEALVDEGSFFELGRDVVHRHGHKDDTLAANAHPGDGLVCGVARVANRRIAVYAHDPTVMRGALGHAASTKLVRLLDVAASEALPVVAFADSDGVRIAEGTDAVAAYGDVIGRTIALHGRVPQLTLVSGLCVGAAAYNAALTDFVAMVAGQSFMFITGPRVTQAVTGEDVAIDALGGSELHATVTGSAHQVVENERDGVAWLKRMLDALVPHAPVPHAESADPADRDTPEVQRLVPVNERRAYDMRKLVTAVCDARSVLELSPRFAPNLLTCLARLDGRAVAVMASQPMHKAGCLDVAASRKGAHFVRFANARGLPVVTFVDVPGYVPGKQQEEGGILAFGSELLSAYGEARVPGVCLVVRKSYGGANVLSFSARVRLALPTAAVAPMGALAAADMALGPLAADASDEQQQARAAFLSQWRERYETVWSAANDGYFDKVIAPVHARRELCAALAALLGDGA